jgi:hypothetical protein
MEIVKIRVVVGGLGGVGKKEEQVEHTFLGGWNYTV